MSGPPHGGAADLRVGSLYYYTLDGRPDGAVAVFLRGLSSLTGAAIVDIGPRDGGPGEEDRRFTRDLWRRRLPPCDVYLVHRPHHLGALRDTPAWPRVVYIAHTPYGACGLAQALSERMLLRELRGGRAVALSPSVANSYRGRNAVVRPLPPPLVGPPSWERDAARARVGVPGDGPVLGWVGRLAAEKRPLWAVDVAEAAADLLGRRLTLVIAGDGDERDALERRVRSLRTGRLAVRVLGTVAHEEIGSVYAASDALLVTSRFEATHFASVEAALAGTPVVGRPVGDVPLVAAATSRDVHGLAEAAAAILRGGGADAGRSGRARARALYDPHAAAIRWSELLCEAASSA